MARGKATFERVFLKTPVDVKYSKNGIPWCELPISINKKNKETGQWESVWIRARAFKDIAEDLGKFPPNSYIDVTCTMSPSLFTDRNGNDRKEIDWFVEEIRKTDESNSPASNYKGNQNGSNYQSYQAPPQQKQKSEYEGFMTIPDDVDGGLPFN